jgi:hypothetical protein
MNSFPVDVKLDMSDLMFYRLLCVVLVLSFGMIGASFIKK